MKVSDPAVLAHHQPAAAVWARGGKDYDEVSFAISDAHAHSVSGRHARVHPRWQSSPRRSPYRPDPTWWQPAGGGQE